MTRATVNYRGSIHEKNGYLYLVFRYVHPVTKKDSTKWKSLKLKAGATKRAIREKEMELQAEFDKEYEKMCQGANSSGITLYQFFDNWLTNVKSAQLQPSTIRSYRSLLERKIVKYFGKKKKLADVTPADIMGFYATFRKDNLKETTVLHYHNILHGGYKYAMKQEIIDKNPMDKVDRPSIKKFRTTYYNEEELKQLLALAQDDQIYVVIALSAYLGLRRSEALGLMWDCVDFERNLIRIEHKVVEYYNPKTKASELMISDELKTETSRRTLPLPQALKAVLLEHRQRQEALRQLFKRSYSTKYLKMVCVDRLGNLLAPDYVTSHFSSLLKQLGMRHIRFHDLRHSCASLLVENKVDMKRIQLLLGHSNYSTTADIYSHLDTRSIEQATDVIDQVFKIDK